MHATHTHTTQTQNCRFMARDIFTRGSDMVASIVVIPLISGNDKALGGMYFALDAPCSFEHLQDTLLVSHRVTHSGYTSTRLGYTAVCKPGFHTLIVLAAALSLWSHTVHTHQHTQAHSNAHMITHNQTQKWQGFVFMVSRLLDSKLPLR